LLPRKVLRLCISLHIYDGAGSRTQRDCDFQLLKHRQHDDPTPCVFLLFSGRGANTPGLTAVRTRPRLDRDSRVIALIMFVLMRLASKSSSSLISGYQTEC
jgi:hypothetical protein